MHSPSGRNTCPQDGSLTKVSSIKKKKELPVVLLGREKEYDSTLYFQLLKDGLFLGGKRPKRWDP